MEYVGEHLWAGTLGEAFVYLAFSAGVLSAVSYFLAERHDSTEWKKLGRFSFIAHTIGVLGMVSMLFFMIFNQYFEYHYIWQHSSSDLPLRFIFSCFWEGIEGSFMLWMLWHVILAGILLKTVKSWESPVMAVYMLVQVFLGSMILGVSILGYKLGSNPFSVLMREHPDFASLPIFQIPEYTSVLDGRGLNPLLQNYWMTIHPPIVFLGFASTLIPFTYAIAGLWRRAYVEWVKPALPWTFFGVGILGTGILMGGAWAYEALSFGGFWAWDPVENASLVPWLTLVGAGHLMLIQRSKGVSVLSLFIFTCVSLILVQYSSFLTKSGILGETSVHSFTDLGMTGHLALCLIALVVLSVGLIISRYKEFPNAEKEESIWSREFWMFIGALILLISAFQIGYSTSFPVINKIFGTELATPSNVHEYYNRWQLPLAIIVALFVSVGQFLKYKSTDPKTLIKKLSVSLSLSIVLTLVFALSLEISNAFILGLTFTSSFAVLANLDYLLRILNGNLKKGGSSIAHVGFGLVLLGAVISTSQQEVISENTSLFDVTKLDDGFTNTENILLMKDDTLLMGTYFVSYRGKKKEGHFIHYQVDYLAQNSEGELDSVFSLFPFIQLNPRMGNVAEPYTKHYLDRDVYTYIAYAEIEDRKSEEKGSSHEIEVGDTIFSRSSFIVLDSLNRFPNREGSNLREKDMALGASFSVYDVNTEKHLMEPLFVIRDRRLTFSVPDSVRSAGIKVFFDGIDPEKQKFKFRLLEQDDAKKEFIVMKAIVFPYINILWLGCILMALGSFLAVFNRIRKK